MAAGSRLVCKETEPGLAPAYPRRIRGTAIRNRPDRPILEFARSIVWKIYRCPNASLRSEHDRIGTHVFLVERALALIYLYHLRLDWLTWFAAMDSPENHPWMREPLGLYFPPVAHR